MAGGSETEDGVVDVEVDRWRYRVHGGTGTRVRVCDPLDPPAGAVLGIVRDPIEQDRPGEQLEGSMQLERVGGGGSRNVDDGRAGSNQRCVGVAGRDGNRVGSGHEEDHKT
jgi:hypothetical protein